MTLKSVGNGMSSSQLTFTAVFFGFGLENDDRGRPKNDTPLSYQDLIETVGTQVS